MVGVACPAQRAESRARFSGLGPPTRCSGDTSPQRHVVRLMTARQPPAILKGWIDRVLRENVAYAFPPNDNGGGLPLGLLPAKAALVFNTSNTPEARETNVFGDPLQRLWRDCIFAFCGVNVFDRLMFRVIADSTATERALWLEQAAAMAEKYFGD